jgi:hypothetical protein
MLQVMNNAGYPVSGSMGALINYFNELFQKYDDRDEIKPALMHSLRCSKFFYLASQGEAVLSVQNHYKTIKPYQ